MSVDLQSDICELCGEKVKDKNHHFTLKHHLIHFEVSKDSGTVKLADFFVQALTVKQAKTLVKQTKEAS